MALSLTHSNLPYPVRKARYSLLVEYRDTAGALTNPTAPDTEFSIDGGANFTDCAEEVSPTAGHGYITLSGAETDNAAVKVQAKGTGVLTASFDLYPRDLPILATGTATAGANSTITLQVGASAVDDYYNGMIVRTTGGTGGGGTGGADNQARVILDYVGSTRVATISGTWGTNPSSDTTYDLLVTAEWAQAQSVRTLLALPAAAPGASAGLIPIGTGAGAVNVGTGVLDANALQLAGVAQSLTDLKDFADTGYDPSTHRAAANLEAILATAITESAGGGKVAQAFIKLFNVVTPTLVASDVMRGTDGAALASAWTAARAGYVDELNAATDGVVAEIIKTCFLTLSNRVSNSGLNALLGIPDTAAHTMLTDLPDAVWDETSTGHTDAGKAGAAVWTTLPGIATVLTGITSLAAWLRGLARKSAMDSTAKTELNTGGGDYDEATDSNEAIRDTAPLGTAMRGTDGAALASTWTAARAAALDRVGNTYFVDVVAGSDSTGDGSRALPWKTATKAEADGVVSGHGDTIVMLPQAAETTWQEAATITSAKNDFTIRGAGRGVIWKGVDGSTDILNLTGRNVEVTNCRFAGASGGSEKAIIGTGNGRRIHNCWFEGFTYEPPVEVGVHARVHHNWFADCGTGGDSTGVLSLIGTSQHDSIIEDNWFRNCRTPVVLIGGGDNIAVLRNTFLYTDTDPAGAGPYDIQLNSGSQRCTIAENNLSRTGTVLDNGTNNVKQNNEQWATATNLATTDAVADAIKVVTDKLATMLALETCPNYQFTEEALELAPAGGSGSADWTANERLAIRAILGVAADNATPTDPTVGILDTIRDSIASLGAGTGAAAVTLIVKKGGVVTEGVAVTLQASGGTNVQTTDVDGEVVFNRDNGTWDYVIEDTAAYTGSSGHVAIASGVVTSPAGGILTITAIGIPVPTSADNYVVWATERSLDGAATAAHEEVTVTVVDCSDSAMYTAADGVIRRLKGTSFHTDANGQWSFQIEKTAVASGGQITLKRVWTTGEGGAVKSWAKMDASKATAGGQIAWAAWEPKETT